VPTLNPETRRPARPPAELFDRDRRPPAPPPPQDGGGEPDPESRAPWSNARLGMLMLLGGEAMFFGGLVMGFLQLRLGAPVWPPPGQPRLPVGLTAVNTAVLLLSSYTLTRATRAVRADDRRGLVRWLGRTLALGTLFLLVQGLEWARLVGFGLTVRSGVYGATFYTLIGIHGAHVLGAVVWLALVTLAAQAGRYRREAHTSLLCCAMYWHFVVALWPVLYLLVYLV
jgi:cytochrome c oxidase subunit III